MTATQKLKFLYRAWRYRWKVEPREVAFVLEQLQPGQTALDVGAHKGAFTYWMQRAVGPGGRVFSFEPQHELADYLQAATTALRLSQVTVENMALSSARGEVSMIRPDDAPSPGATLELGAHAFGAHRMTVKAETLDHYFAERAARPIHFMKCDVEGHELDVFQGGRRLLVEDRPVLLFECEQRHHGDRSMDQVFDFLSDLGYEGYFHFRDKLHRLGEFRADEHQNPAIGAYVNNFSFLPQRSAVTRRPLRKAA